MKLTPFGKEIRKLRIEKGMLMKEMADKLNVSPSWLSAVETGRKNAPDGLAQAVARLFDLGADPAERLVRTASDSRVSFTITPGNDALRRDVAAALARRFSDFEEDELRQLQALVLKGTK